MKDEGVKHDTGKARYDLLPPDSLEEIVLVLTFGADKYGPHNWERGLSYSRVFAACMRHLWAWWRGEALDTETGYSHLAHAICCCMFLLAYDKRESVQLDDRQSKEATITDSQLRLFDS